MQAQARTTVQTTVQTRRKGRGEGLGVLRKRVEVLGAKAAVPLQGGEGRGAGVLPGCHGERHLVFHS